MVIIPISPWPLLLMCIYILHDNLVAFGPGVLLSLFFPLSQDISGTTEEVRCRTGISQWLKVGCCLTVSPCVPELPLDKVDRCVCMIVSLILHNFSCRVTSKQGQTHQSGQAAYY